jgi:hypothetical protein
MLKEGMETPRDIESDKQEATAWRSDGNRINDAQQIAPPIHKLLNMVRGDLLP